jgi:glucose/arabinose dehydrogenase
MPRTRATIHIPLFILVALLIPGWLCAQPYQLAEAFPNLTFSKPVYLTHAGDRSNRLFVVQQTGIIRVFANDSTTTAATTFLDIAKKISSSGGEEGLLGLAFHPQFPSNGIFFVNYTAPNPLRTVIAKYRASSVNSAVADTAEEVLLEVSQPFSNHNGGMLSFGPDGYLYVGLGDGGSGGDPLNNGQSLNTLLGKILRIDVDGRTPSRKYLIPPDNPFAGNLLGYREEIWAYGLRNPWRFSFDRISGQLWAGDVGQGAFEEVDRIERGKNYGWRIMEGFACYNPASNCSQTGLDLPVVDYSHSLGSSITGGYVYRGSRRPDLAGTYLYGDYVSGRIWSLRMVGSQVQSNSLLLIAPGLISSFGEDESGELYIVTYASGTPTKILHFVRSTATDSEVGNRVPGQFRLEQNFPNPFNPTTVVSYQLPVAGNVKLAIYDLLGREVAVLVNERKSPGTHAVQFNAQGLASGVYLYRIDVRPSGTIDHTLGEGSVDRASATFTSVRELVVLR